MKKQIHSLLKRQLKLHFGDTDSIPEEWKKFISTVNDAYQEFDEDRSMLERSLDLSSQELIQANSELQALIRAFPDLFIWLDINGTILDCKEGSTTNLFIPLENLIGKPIQSIPLQNVGKKFHEAISQVRDANSIVSMEYSLTINGSKNYFEARMLPLLEDRFLCIVRNITERKQAEQAVVESEDRFRSLARYAPFGLSVMKPDNSFEYLNQKFTDIFGYTLLDIPDKHTWFEKAYPDKTYRENIAGIYNSDISTAVKGGKTESRIFTVTCKDGSNKIIHFQTVVLNNNLVFITYEDITDRARVEAALRKSEESFKALYEESRKAQEVYRSLIHSSADAIVIYDLEGRVKYLSPAFTNIFGWKIEELEGKKIPFVPESELKATDATVRDVILHGKPCQGFMTRRFTKNGGLLDVSYSASRFDDHEGNPSGTLFVLRDITERKKLEARYRKAEKMEAIGMLAGGVAHDLNNILSGIVSYPDLLLLKLPKDSPLQKGIKIMQTSGQKAAAIVQDLLTMARRGVAISEVINLNEIITEYLKSPEYDKLLFHHPNVMIKTDLENNLANILGSPVHISKTIMNLVSNGVESMPDGGMITITSKNQHLDKPIIGYEKINAGDYVTISVADTGTGISPETLERIFEPFFTKKVMGRSGTGLGMAVIWGTVKDHNGFIDVQSKEKSGTSFTVYFPLTHMEMEKSKGIIAFEDYQGNGETILVVDDVQEQLEIASNLLSQLGYSVSTALNGETAVEYMKNHKADLLILDMIMEPGIDGLETYRQILEMHPRQPAIITSGFSESARVKEAQKLGAGTYVKKPYMLETIGVAVRDMLAR